MSVTIVAEIGLNHNGDLRIARRLIDAADFAGADVVKFQKRSPEHCVPPDQRDVLRDTPWGQMTYMEYRHRMEFSQEQYAEIDDYCRQRGIVWTASAWDLPSLNFLSAWDLPFVKIPSALLTRHDLLLAAATGFRHVVLSTGMSTEAEIDAAVRVLSNRDAKLTLLHCHSAYPAPSEELNLRCIPALRDRHGLDVGYSGHEYGIRAVLAAVALGATMIERHITLDHAMWGSDHESSVMPVAFQEMVRHIRSIEASLGDGQKRVWDSELPAMRKLRGTPGPAPAWIQARIWGMPVVEDPGLHAGGEMVIGDWSSPKPNFPTR